MRIAPSSSIVAVMAHPDDIKSVTGVALRALESESSVSLIQVTKGEGLVSAARNTLTPLEMGSLRMEELRQFLGMVGIPEKNLFVIGVPDGSQTLPALRDDFFKVEGDPFIDPLLQTDRVPYDDVYKPGMLFYGEALLATLQELFIALQPGMILTHHPKDDHADHRAVSFFACKACRHLYRQRKLNHMPSIYATLVYYRRCLWSPKGDYFYTDPIKNLFSHLKASQFCLTEQELALKKQASMVFTPTLSVEYIQGEMKKDEVLWRLR